MKEGSIVIEIEESKETFFDQLEDLFRKGDVSYKSYKVNDGKLIAPIASKPVNGESEVTQTIALYVPFYKLIKLEIPNEEEANKLIEEQLENELETSIKINRAKRSPDGDIEK